MACRPNACLEDDMYVLTCMTNGYSCESILTPLVWNLAIKEDLRWIATRIFFLSVGLFKIKTILQFAPKRVQQLDLDQIQSCYLDYG